MQTPDLKENSVVSSAENNVPAYNYRMNTIAIRYGRNTRPQGAGFTLIELAIVLLILSLLLVFLLPTSTAFLNTRKHELTRQKLKNIETAIANYVAVNKRLPCPADGTAAPGSAGAGNEGARDVNGDCTNSQATGVVPWVAIGLTQADIEDGWQRRITYRAGFGLTRDSALDMSSCDPAGTKPAPQTDTSGNAPPGGRCWTTCVGTNMATCTAPQDYLTGKGFDIRDGAGNLIMSVASYTSAAYVLISHGDNGYGAYGAGGTYIATASSGVAGAIEAYNINGPAKTVTSAIPSSANTFRDAAFTQGAAGTYSDNPATYFDDLLVRPSLFSVIQRAQVGPRSH